MDADLAAFAIAARLRMITLDQDVRQYLGAGLDLDLLQADASDGTEPPPHTPRWQAEAIATPPPSFPVPAPALPALPVVETFHSLQGEGMHAGRSAFFIRLAGCDVGCPWCDTKHSWPEAAHPRRPLADLAAEAGAAASAGAAFVVITGGEPLQQPLADLCAALKPAGLPLHLETSGVGELSGRFDWITLSPKPHRPPGSDVLARCHELKVVVSAPEDLAFAEAMAAEAVGRRPPAEAGPRLLLQPAWEQPGAQELAVAYVRHHPAWRLSLQSHKWLGVR